MSTEVPVRDDEFGKTNWSRVKAELRSTHGEDIYGSWFERIEFECLTGNVAELSTPTAFIRHWTQNHYGTEILKRWRHGDPEIAEVRFKVRGSIRTKDGELRAAAPIRRGGPVNASSAPRTQVSLPEQRIQSGAAGLEGSPLEERFTFDTYVEGAPNQFAVAAAKKVAFAAPNEPVSYNPLFVSAAVGLGKTHLLQAVAQAAIEFNPNRRVLYLTAEHFMYRFVGAMRSRNTLSFKDILREVDCLIIDDLQFLNGQRVQEEFGHTLTALVDSGKQVVIAADRAPTDLDGLEPRVRSRLCGGLLVDLKAPDYAMRRAILAQRIEARREAFPDLDFPDEVQDYVARAVTTTGRDLEGAFTRLVVSNQLTGDAISVKKAETMLEDLFRAHEARKPKIEDIQRVVSTHFDISRQDLVSARRTRNIVRPRQIAMYLCKTLTPRSLPEIGRRFGNRDHTTVLHAVRKVEELAAEDRAVAEHLETLKRLLDQ